MSRTVWTWARLAGAAATFAVLVWRLGTGPFLDGVRTVDGRALAAAAGIAVLTTVCCAWRWKIVARGLGVDLPLPAAVAAYYRSQFLNVTLPGGVVGDVHRGISHGRDVSDVGRGLRAVAWERSAGQVVQVVLTVVVLLVLPSPVRSSMPLVAIALVVAVLGRRARGSRATRRRPLPLGAGPERRGRPTSATDCSPGGRGWASRSRPRGRRRPRGHLPDRRADRGHRPRRLSRMLPLALLVLLAMVLPSVAGWGPREGVTAWAFAAAGLGADQGSPPPSSTASWCSSPACRAPPSSCWRWFRRTAAPAATRTARSRARVPVAVRPDGAPHA